MRLQMFHPNLVQPQLSQGLLPELKVATFLFKGLRVLAHDLQVFLFVVFFELGAATARRQVARLLGLLKFRHGGFGLSHVFDPLLLRVVERKFAGAFSFDVGLDVVDPVALPKALDRVALTVANFLVFVFIGGERFGLCAIESVCASFVVQGRYFAHIAHNLAHRTKKESLFSNYFLANSLGKSQVSLGLAG